MKISSLANFKGGWFLGHFLPTLRDTREVEVAVKEYQAGDAEPAHHHKIATEWTVVISGEVEMNGTRYRKGDIIELQPNQVSAFRAVTEATITVVKIPSVPGDKYPS